MWERWSELLETLGRIRLGFRLPRSVPVGNPAAPDAQGTMDWRGFRKAEDLYRVWSPVRGGPWEPFHCVPLFAALDRIPESRIGPTHPGTLAPPVVREEESGPLGKLPGPPQRPSWLDDHTWTIVDIPGRRCVEAAVWLILRGGCQPVCTFDNWPHVKGVVQAEDVLAELLRWASTVGEARGRLRPDSPPVWICDSRRLGRGPGSPGQFDNRYYLDDSILPGPGYLRRHGIRKVVYLTWREREVPIVDLESYFADLLGAGIPILHRDLDTALSDPRPLSAPRSPRPPPRSGFRRSAAGGFGTTVPEPSSGSGSGG